jgi:hypothetical protein
MTGRDNQPDKKIPIEQHQETATFRGSGVAVLFSG